MLEAVFTPEMTRLELSSKHCDILTNFSILTILEIFPNKSPNSGARASHLAGMPQMSAALLTAMPSLTSSMARLMSVMVGPQRPTCRRKTVRISEGPPLIGGRPGPPSIKGIFYDFVYSTPNLTHWKKIAFHKAGDIHN